MLPLLPSLHIFTSAIVCCPSPPLNLSEISIIPHIYHPSVFIFLVLCCVHHPLFFHCHEYFAAVVCLCGSCVSSVSSATSIYSVNKYLPHHHSHQTRNFLYHFHRSPAFIAIMSFIHASLFIVCFHCFDPLLSPPPPCASRVA